MVDDEAPVREMARMVFRRLNLKLLTANNGEEGLRLVSSHRAEISGVITDMHMPHMDGLVFVRALRQVLPDIPVAVASGRMEEPVAEELRKLGVIHRLDKPFTEARLVEVLKSFLRPKS